MDMNELLRQHQIALINASPRGVQSDQQVPRILVAFYAQRIRCLRANWGLPLAF